MGHVVGQIVLKNFAAQIKQRLDITDSCSRYSLIKGVLAQAESKDSCYYEFELQS